MIIGVCSYGGTGSSAVVDLLKEYNELQVLGNAEFQYAFQPDGLEDLEYHLVKQHSRHMSGDVAIHRYINSTVKWAETPLVHKTIEPKIFKKITYNYVNSLIQDEWIGIDNSDYMTKSVLKNSIVLGFKKIVFPVFEKITKKSWDVWPARGMYLSINPEDFYEKTQTYTTELLKAAGASFEKPVVLDQPFEGDAPEQSFPFFKDPKAIVVDRDPRDLWILAKYAGNWTGEGRFMPRKDVKTFVNYYKELRENAKRNNSHDVITINFEDLVYEYDTTVKKIENFLSINEHVNPKKYFDPSVSINNTRLMDRYPQSKADIDYIEKNLTNYLYDFSKYKKVNYTTSIF